MDNTPPELFQGHSCQRSNTAAINYCGSNVCNNSKQHTLCKFKSSGPGPNCIGYQKTVTTDDQKNALLEKINSQRNKIAAGEVRSFPPAENMMKLEWNEELEVSAQRWADQCVSQGATDIQDDCRDLVTVAVGQNIASVYGEAPGLSPLSLVDVWYMELLNSNSSILKRYLPSINKGFPHYDYFTQLVWARSTEVGCGGAKFQERLKDTKDSRNRTVHRLVCNFAPGGNILGEPVYSEGPPCSRCPDGGTCDLEHTALCSKNNKTYSVTNEEQENINTSVNADYQLLPSDEEFLKENATTIPEISTNVEPIEEDKNITDFDYFSHLYDFTRQPVTIATKKVTNPCKDSMAVDEFVELLKKKLSSDSMFKELLLSTKNPSQNGNMDSTYSDPSVAAFVSRIYSKKVPTTTTKIPEFDYVNSTLLVDLVEAVIFRSSDKTHATEVTIDTLQPASVGPIKIQAELGEVKVNHDFTGHYFFPEDITEESAIETVDSYYDSSNVPVSDVISEIENLKRDKTTQDFLDEIIESDSATDESKVERKKRKSDAQYLESLYDFDNNNYNVARKSNPIEIIVNSYDYEDENIKVKYDDLLRKIAEDLKMLKLNKRFHCSLEQSMYK
ncbi:uncharacterized protein LOC114364001 [Ostrinia furnacalis]|uniref:uncharacterized protein LOC114364001 n=1 Tax=Ostrinia furnacalis TaxID=93504 RepID=UPI00103E9000|nr:uncharacterized protein LOC114364001 [Ostrinia furnacalis]